MALIIGPILDSAGSPASGLIHVNVSRPFNSRNGFVSQAAAIIRVDRGVPYDPMGREWQMPTTPAGVKVQLRLDLDGEQVRRYEVAVPDVAQITWAALLLNTPEPSEAFFWDLTGGAPFPPQAFVGDFGIDTVTGDIWRNNG